jgi:hypothetical protein
MRMGRDDNLFVGAHEFVVGDEEVVAACIANPKGWGQMMASGGNFIAREIAARKQRKSRAAATEAGLAIDAPMGLVLTSRRLLTLKVKQTAMGKTSSIEGLIGQVELERVSAITVKRFGLGKRITVNIEGREAPLEGNAGASELGDAFAGVQTAV